ncbi:MAG: hypothetical protein AABW51_05575 [Nanoarchaeota archaeon]
MKKRLNKRLNKKIFVLGLLSILLVTSLYFVFAAHVIKTSAGTTAFSVNQITSNFYNFSVNNTDAGLNANITFVNVTLPLEFTYVVNTNTTDVAVSAFTNISTVLSWSNTTSIAYLVNGSGKQFFGFNATASTPGTYNITVTTVNATSSYSTNLSVTVNDTTAPAINFVSPTTLSANTFYIRSNITFNVTSNDSVGIGTINATLYNSNNVLINSSALSSSPFAGTFAGLGDGIYYLNASVNDTSGNTNSTSTLKIILASNSFEFNGTVYDTEGNALNNSLINISVRDTSNQFSVVGYISTTTNSSGWFNLSIYQEITNSTWMYQPVMTLTNSTSNYVQYIGQSLPAFPGMIIQQIAGTKFYLKEAGTLNITAVNATGASVPFKYQIKDIKLGYPIAEEFQNDVTQKTIYVPKDRNYSIMIFPNASMPVSFEWNNFSATTDYTLSDSFSNYNNSTKTLHKRFNISMSYVRLYGYVNASGVSGWNNFTVVAYMLEPGDMVHAERGAIPYNLSAFFVVGGTDIYNNSNGFYNISLPSTAEISSLMLFATGTNNSVAYGSLMNVSFNSTASPAGFNISRNFTMYRLLGSPATISLNNLGGNTFNVSTAMYSFGLINSSNVTLSNINAHSEITVDYSSNISGIRSFTWIADVGQGSSSSLQAPLLNISSIGIKEINVFAGGGNYAPKRTTFTNAQLQSARNITTSSFNPGKIDGSSLSGLKIALFKSNLTCDVPNPSSACVLGSTEDTGGESFSNFNPMKSVMGGGKISFRMGLLSSGIIVHYVNVDMLASGPPDALFDDSATTSTSGSFESAMRFGSNGPTIYDYVIVSMPYTEGNSSTTGLSESGQVNISIPLFYDESWGVIWNATANGTNGTYLSGNNSHYSTYSSQWETLMRNNTCVTDVSIFNSTNPCYINTTSNRIWIRLPHFSGTQPSITGSVITATATTTSSSSSSGGGSSSSSSGVTYTVSESQFLQGYSRNLVTKDKLKFNVSNESHTLEVTSISLTSATINISSTPQTATLSKGETKKFDITSDGYYDIAVTLNDITIVNNTATRIDLAIKQDSGQVSPSAPSSGSGETKGNTTDGINQETGQKNSVSQGSSWWIWALIVVVILAVIGFILYKKKKK